MDHVLRVLRDKQVDPEIQRGHPGSNTQASDHTRAAVLFDFLDEGQIQRLQHESADRMQRIQSVTDELQELVTYFGEQRTGFKSYLTSAITLDESALSFAREKMELQERHTTSMAKSLISLANHYDQVAQVLTYGSSWRSSMSI